MVLTRKLKDLSISVLMFFHGIGGMLLPLIWILFDVTINKNRLQIVSYSKTQYLILLATTLGNALT